MEFNVADSIASLKRDTAFPHAVSYAKIIETHISWIILTGAIAYKVKKTREIWKCTNLIHIIYFMMCFKACIRAKVSLFSSMQCTDKTQKMEHIKEVKDHFSLAKKYLTMF